MIEQGLTLQTAPLDRHESDHGIVRIDPADLKRLGLAPGARVALHGGRVVYATAQAIGMEYRNQEMICVDDLQLHNCGIKPGDRVLLRPAPSGIAPIESLTLVAQTPLDARAAMARLALLKRQLDGLTVSFGDMLRLHMPDQYDMLLHVKATPGNVPGIIRNITKLTVTTKPGPSTPLDHLGGLRREFMFLEERLALVRAGEAREYRSIILQGPPGCGKAMLVESVAASVGAYCDRVSGTRLVADVAAARLTLQQSFTAAAKQAPAVIVIDDIDLLVAETADWQRMTLACQLYEQLDLMPGRVPLLVIGLMHRTCTLDPAALRPGRFGQIVTVSPPDRENRMEVLDILSHQTDLADDVDLWRLSAMTKGYVGADLAALFANATAKAQRGELLRARATGHVVRKQSVSMNHLRAALTEIVPISRDDIISETPELQWQDIAGLDEVKQILREAVERPINHGSQFDARGAQPPHGVLVTGAPGTGKTSIVRALASATNAHFLHISCADIILAADPRDLLRRIFIKARQSAPCMLFFDNIEHIIPIGEASGTDKIHVVYNAFLRELDATSDLSGLTIFGATSHADRIDQILMRPGRFDYVINIPLPDTLTRQKIFAYHAHKLPLAEDVDFDILAEMTTGYSGADIENICRRAGLIALRQSIGGGELQAPPMVNMLIFEQILRGWRR